MHHSSFIERLWAAGQQHLETMRYAAAVRCLEAAEAAAWGAADGVALARLYLPLLEARRQIRYQAADGVILICGAAMPDREVHAAVRDFLRDRKMAAGTLLVHADRTKKSGAMRHVGKLRDAARRESRWLEALLLLNHGNATRLVSPADPTFAAGLPVYWSRSQTDMVGDAGDPNLQIPLPGAGRFTPGQANHATARESLIAGWEALALKWQHRHPPQRHGGVWEEIAWLRRALRIDPACEPVAMRLMALAEAAARAPA